MSLRVPVDPSTGPVETDKRFTIGDWSWDMDRRSVLVSCASCIAIAGCVSQDSVSSESDEGPNTTESGCSVREDSVFKDFEIPSELTKESAKEFAVDAEEIYGKERAEKDDWSIAGTDSTETTIQSRESGGYYVKVVISLDGTKETEVQGKEETLYGDLGYEGWYRITNSSAQRAPGDSAEPPEDGWRNVSCDSKT